jgi:hypothetical protein
VVGWFSEKKGGQSATGKRPGPLTADGWPFD